MDNTSVRVTSPFLPLKFSPPPDRCQRSVGDIVRTDLQSTHSISVDTLPNDATTARGLPRGTKPGTLDGFSIQYRALPIERPFLRATLRPLPYYAEYQHARIVTSQPTALYR